VGRHAGNPALACGTPVVAFRRGSVPEVLEDGVSGFIVDGADGAVRAVGRLGQLSRRRCRQAFERRLTAERKAGDYLAVYRRLIAERGRGAVPPRRREQVEQLHEPAGAGQGA
jgi:glycosyltransferase involved in cell wall biosynthesis